MLTVASLRFLTHRDKYAIVNIYGVHEILAEITVATIAGQALKRLHPSAFDPALSHFDVSK